VHDVVQFVTKEFRAESYCQSTGDKERERERKRKRERERERDD